MRSKSKERDESRGALVRYGPKADIQRQVRRGISCKRRMGDWLGDPSYASNCIKPQKVILSRS